MLNFKNIKLVVIDVDGTLTDGIYQMSDDGRLTKSFYTRDFWAIEQMLASGKKVLILTQAADRVITAQFDRLARNSNLWRDKINSGELDVRVGALNKLMDFIGVCNGEHLLSEKSVLYIGDAENDLECMKMCGLTACPSDAVEIIQSESNYVSRCAGGHGAIYDIYKYLTCKEENDADSGT